MTDSSAGYFDKLPAELRNRIYELALVPDMKEEDGFTDLLASSPPRNSLLIACRRFYREAKGIYKTAYRDYWSKTKFSVTITVKGPVYENGKYKLERDSGFFEETYAEDLNHITSLRLEYDDIEDFYEMLDARGAWRCNIFQRTNGFVIRGGLYGWVTADEHHFDTTEEMERLFADSTYVSLQDQLKFLM